jgi:hypothetical protein
MSSGDYAALPFKRLGSIVITHPLPVGTDVTDHLPVTKHLMNRIPILLAGPVSMRFAVIGDPWMTVRQFRMLGRLQLLSDLIERCHCL